GEAEYETVKRVKKAVSIPVVVNGDIRSPQQARRVLKRTAADAVMIGRAVQGQPWFPMMVADYLVSGGSKEPKAPNLHLQKHTCLEHIRLLHAFYGEKMGVRIARKHIRWYIAPFTGGFKLSQEINQSSQPGQILDKLEAFYDQQLENLTFENRPQGLAA
ncbi:MAG: tRNA dihydrouridine synthase DusB, partial [Proteobacteria bacterium]|nr:tRNA dihydrouridine synthase DusB [Pseudomonadota bacterium]